MKARYLTKIKAKKSVYLLWLIYKLKLYTLFGGKIDGNLRLADEIYNKLGQM
jgi:hypothetical protein